MKPSLTLLLLSLPLFSLTAQDSAVNAVDQARARIEELKGSGKLDTTAEGWRTRLPKFAEFSFASGGQYLWTLETSEGTMVARLDPESAPEHVRNTIWLSELGYYDGLNFHRIIPGFMAQGGCPLGKGFGNPGYSLKLEVKPGVIHDTAGVLSMARTANPNSAGSQFFITFGKTPSLDGQYSVFGRVTEGLDVLKKFEAAGNPIDGRPPLKDIRIVKARVTWQAEAAPAP